jgi:ubiquinol-cytochrome c reductase cytochrome c1 subunit
MRRLIFTAIAAALAIGGAASGAQSARAAEAMSLPAQSWSFGGIFGTFDRANAQRGFQVYKEVCTACHSLNQIRFRDLRALGFNEDEVKALAAEIEVTDGPNDEGQMFQRPGRPADRMKSPFPNEKAARAANNGAYPPDLSLIVKARKGGADYLYALLIGYGEAPAGVTIPEGMLYNKYFPGHQIAMPDPLNPDQVTYSDGTKATVDQMAKDVTTFLAWTAEPEMEQRKALGVKVILFLIVLTFLLYAVKRKVWAALH